MLREGLLTTVRLLRNKTQNLAEARNLTLVMSILVLYPRLSQGKWVSPLVHSQHKWWVVEHGTNEKYTPIMASSFKKSKRYLSDSDSENETEFTRFIIIESLDEMKLDQLLPFLIEKNHIE